MSMAQTLTCVTGGVLCGPGSARAARPRCRRNTPPAPKKQPISGWAYDIRVLLFC